MGMWQGCVHVTFRMELCMFQRDTQHMCPHTSTGSLETLHCLGRSSCGRFLSFLVSFMMNSVSSARRVPGGPALIFANFCLSSWTACTAHTQPNFQIFVKSSHTHDLQGFAICIQGLAIFGKCVYSSWQCVWKVWIHICIWICLPMILTEVWLIVMEP